MLIIVPIIIGLIVGPLVGISLTRHRDVILLIFSFIGVIGALCSSIFVHLIQVHQSQASVSGFTLVNILSSLVGVIIFSIAFAYIYDNRTPSLRNYDNKDKD